MIHIIKKYFIIFIFTLCSAQAYTQTHTPEKSPYTLSDDIELGTPQTLYGYRDREHTMSENLKNLGFIYAITWLMLPTTQYSTFRDDGSFREYRKNFATLVWDKDEPFWNWIVHPISGSQLYLYYRANGYDRWSSVGMTAISQALWEFTVEIYTEPTSFQDNYITSVWGPVLGFGLEKLSMHLLNNGGKFSRFFGHAINPSTLFWFYEGKVHFVPQVDYRPGREQLAGFFVLEF